MQTESRLEGLVNRLNKGELRPDTKVVQELLAAGQPAVAPLIGLATDELRLFGAPEDTLGPLHALRLLGELRAPELLEPLLALFPLESPDHDPQDPILNCWLEDAPQMLARVGAAIAPRLWQVARDREQPGARRDLAIMALAYMADSAPETRAELLAGLRELLVDEPDPGVAGSLVAGLALQNAAEAYAEVMAAYRDKRVDTGVIRPGVARQLLLTRRSEDVHRCALHGFWERYDYHGPSEEDLAEYYGDEEEEF